MKLLFINTLYYPDIGGGAEIVLRNQAETLASLGHQVDVLTIGRTPEVQNETIGGVSVWRVGYHNQYFHLNMGDKSAIQKLLWHARDSYNATMGERAAAVLAAVNPDVAICHNLAGWSISIWDILKRLNIPIVQVLHDQYLICVRSNRFKNGLCKQRCKECRLLRLPHRQKSNQVSAVVGVSGFILQRLIDHNYFAASGVRAVVRNVSHLTRLTEPTAAVPEDRRQLVTFGFIGTLTESKGITRLLDDFLSSARSDWRLVVAGKGAGEFERELKTRYQDPRVSFVGHVEPTAFFSRIDLTVVPSLWEDTLPSVVFESLLCGRPVLANRLGGIPEMVSHGTNGLLMEPGDSNGIRGAMSSAASQIIYWRSLAQQIADDARARYTGAKEWARSWEKIFTSAMVVNKAQHGLAGPKTGVDIDD